MTENDDKNAEQEDREKSEPSIESIELSRVHRAEVIAAFSQLRESEREIEAGLEKVEKAKLLRTRAQSNLDIVTKNVLRENNLTDNNRISLELMRIIPPDGDKELDRIGKPEQKKKKKR